MRFIPSKQVANGMLKDLRDHVTRVSEAKGKSNKR